MTTAKLGKFQVTFDNSEEYHRLKNEIFSQHQYYFETENPQPVIIDAGAHIGLATLYFKKNYPGARVIAIEPQPANFRLLEKNIWENELTDVETYQVALSDKAGTATLYQDATEDHWYSTAGFIPRAWNGQQTSQEISVETLPLSFFLNQPVELLKLDIEGSEFKVLNAALPHLHQVKHMIIEYHPNPEQPFKKLTEFFRLNNFTYEIWQKEKLVTEYERGLALLHVSHVTK